MISNIKIKAFKTFPDKDIILKALTLLSGLNNSGKSSVIQAMRMYNLASQNESPLLEGHGSVNEVRSKFSSSKESIEVSLFYDDLESKMSLSEQGVEKPSKYPELIYVGADRLGPKAFLPLNQKLDQHPVIGDKGEFVIDFIEKLADCIVPDKLRHPEAQGQTFQYVLQGWLTEIAPGIDFSYNKNSKADITHAEIDNFRPTNVGFGLSYTLPIIAALLGGVSTKPVGGWINSWGEDWDKKKADDGCLIVVENPEAHLHPQGQTAMGRLIALAASCGAQVVVETHSDHLMDGIRIAVKKGEISSKDAVFHFFAKTQDGLTDVDSPALDDNGKLNKWPEGFFDQTLKNRAILAKRAS